MAEIAVPRRMTDAAFLVWEEVGEKGTDEETQLRRRSRLPGRWLPIAHDGQLTTVMHYGGWDMPISDRGLIAAFGDEVHPHQFFREEVEAFRRSLREDGGVLYDIGRMYRDGHIEPDRENMTTDLVMGHLLALVNIDKTAKLGKSQIDQDALFGAARIMLAYVAEHDLPMSLDLPCPPAEKLIFRLTPQNNPVPWD